MHHYVELGARAYLQDFIRPDQSRKKKKKQLTESKDYTMIISKERTYVRMEEDMNKDDKLKALDAAITQIEKSYGKGSIMKLGDSGANMNIETTPTGSISLDIALGLGGVPKGRVIEIYGPESSGKTTVALHMVAEVQKRGGIAGFIDAEHALDPVYAKNIGVDIDNLYISSRTTENRVLRSPRRWCAPVQWTS